jgi:hypothetical protein
VHVLQALVLAGTPEQRAVLAGAGARVVRLQEALVLAPVAGGLLARVEAQHPGPSKGPSRTCRFLTGALARFAAQLSRSGPVAYVETDYFGGAGDQAATGWSGGQRVLRRARAGVGPVNAALRWLGVQPSGFQDEFETVGLGRYRETGSWLVEAADP